MRCNAPISLTGPDSSPNGSSFRGRVPCGQCLRCRITRRQEWQLRLQLEALFSKAVFFVTLTYDDSHLPLTDAGAPTLVYAHVQKFLKRLRYFLSDGDDVRYFVVGEYGSRRGRPHWHLLLFADNPSLLGGTLDSKNRIRDSLIDRSWSDGIVDVVPLLTADDRRKVSGYVCGYVLKKLTTTKSAAERWGDDRSPEVSRSSRRPPLGHAAIPYIVSTICRHPGFDPKTFHMLRLGTKWWPLSRHFRLAILRELGYSQDSTGLGGLHMSYLSFLHGLKVGDEKAVAYQEAIHNEVGVNFPSETSSRPLD